MTTEQTAAAPAEPTPAAPQPEPTPKRTLEDIYATVPELTRAPQMPPVQSPTPTTEPQPQPAATIPDPVTAPQNYASYMARQNDDIRQALAQDRAERQAEKDAARKVQDKTDINTAVERLADGVTADKDILRGWLYARAEDDERLAALFNNRASNPAAWDAALAVLHDEAKTKFAARTDAQLVENQAALDQAMAGATTTTPRPDDITEKLLKTPPGEFQREWAKVRAGVYDKR